MTTVVVITPFLVALVGILMYALASNPKLVRIGEILFFCGIFVLTLRWSGASPP